ncbi:hypothetical protein, partial [Rhodoplanes sp. SY1]|uniref:hypothetical protein n=1 Tax=Rhodoplanes sp. SY1 TaxID=3166646 RepID=UPI0038B49A0C
MPTMRWTSIRSRWIGEGNRFGSSVVRTLFGAVGVSLSSCIALAQNSATTPTNVVQIRLFANEPATIKQFAVIDTYTQTVVGQTVPTTFDRPVDSAVDGVKATLDVAARWNDDKRQIVKINVSVFSRITKLDIYFFRYGVSPSTASAFANEKCRFESSADAETLFSRLFACKDLLEWLENHEEAGTRRYYLALRGWFYASWFLFQLGGDGVRPYEMDPDIVRRIETILDDEVQVRQAHGIFKVPEIRRILTQYRTVDIRLVNEVNRLRNAGEIEAAKRLNDFVVDRFPDLQKVVGSSVVDRVNLDLLRKNDQ